MRMTVKEFREFCHVSDIILKDSFNGRVYPQNIENYLNRIVIGFYPRFCIRGADEDSHDMTFAIQIVAWIEHTFEEVAGK